MALSPPELTRSPFYSSSHTYCPSEISSADYSPPSELAFKHHDLVSTYSTNPLTPPMEPEPSLPHFDTLCHPEWVGETMLHHSSTDTLTPNLVSAAYDAYGDYQSTLAPSYPHDLYPTPHAHTQSPSRSPPLAPSRPYSSAPTMVGSMTPRVKCEGAEEYSQGMKMSHCLSSRSTHAGFAVDNGYSSAGSEYLSDGQSPWRTPNYHQRASVDPEQYYTVAHGSLSPPSSTSLQQQDARRPYGATRPRRAPRRLTTREEANFQCEVKGCGKLFSRSYNYKAHLETHDEKREYPFPCTIGECAKKFVRKTDLQRHHQSVHLKEKCHQCDYCSRSFARKDTLRR